MAYRGCSLKDELGGDWVTRMAGIIDMWIGEIKQFSDREKNTFKYDMARSVYEHDVKEIIGHLEAILEDLREIYHARYLDYQLESHSFPQGTYRRGGSPPPF